MGNKLYIGNLSFSVANDDLMDFFGNAGTVQSANVVEDRETGRSRGFGFVEMSSDEEAQNAIEQLNGLEFEGRNIVVNEARPRENNHGGGGRGRGGHGGGRGDYGGGDDYDRW